MLSRALARHSGSRSTVAAQRALSVAHHIRPAMATANGTASSVNSDPHSHENGTSTGTTLSALSKSNVFTSNLPADARFPTPSASNSAPRESLGPALVKNALYTFVRPESTTNPELLAVSSAALHDLNILPSETSTTSFLDLVSGNAVHWDPSTEKGIYPWAQCYGGWQFGSWAGQLGDGRAISLFETTNPSTKERYELQLKGAGKTPYSRFADGKAVLRSSVREFVVSEALNALGIPTTRALSLVLTPEAKVRRERMEPGAIVCRFAQTWLRVGTFDILRARGDRDNIRKLSGYLAEHVFGGWDAVTKSSVENGSEGAKPKIQNGTTSDSADDVKSAADVLDDITTSEENTTTKPKLESPLHLNRYAHLYRHIAHLNAKTVAHWQAYGFTNGVLNTDNTSLTGLSLDFGPFAFIDNFDPSYTPNHDDHALRYSYRNQPSIIWWNLVRLGESLGELIGAGARVDNEEFVTKGVSEDWAPELVARAEGIIEATGKEFQEVFLAEYKRLMGQRLGLKSSKEEDFKELFSEALDTMEALELDFTHFFRRLSSVTLAETDTEEKRKEVAGRFFHAEGPTGSTPEDQARDRVGKWLEKWRARVAEDWGADSDERRTEAMKKVNPNFVPRGWVLDEVIKRVESEGDRKVLETVMRMALSPFEDAWVGAEEEARWCGDPPQLLRGEMCSCSS